MTDNNAAKPAETGAGEKKVGPIRQWIKDHPNIWEFILFNVLSNISTITRFVVTWIGTAIFITGLGLTQPFHFLIFNYDTKGNGLGGFLTFLLAEVLAQVVNFFVQMKWVFKSDSSFKDAAWKYVILAVIIVVVNLVLPGYVTGLCQGWGMNAGIAGTIASVVNTLLAVIVSYPLLKFWSCRRAGPRRRPRARRPPSSPILNSFLPARPDFPGGFSMPASRLMSLEGVAYLANKKGGDSVDEPPPFVMPCYLAIRPGKRPGNSRR